MKNVNDVNLVNGVWIDVKHTSTCHNDAKGAMFLIKSKIDQTRSAYFHFNFVDMTPKHQEIPILERRRSCSLCVSLQSSKNCHLLHKKGSFWKVYLLTSAHLDSYLNLLGTIPRSNCQNMNIPYPSLWEINGLKDPPAGCPEFIFEA